MDAYFKETALTKKQIPTLLDIIQLYDEPDDLSYQILGKIHEGSTYKDILNDLEEEKFGWKGNYYSQYRQTRERVDEMTANPPKMKEGEFKCPRCSKFETVVVEAQTRSADEGYTYKLYCYHEFKNGKQCKYVGNL